ncbi:MAG: serine protease [Proteobacteria bacterium]|nr:serine protease [Pseudomonadota bacterium]
MNARLPDWLIYLAVILALLFAARGRREDAPAPEAPPPTAAGEELTGPVLPGPTRFDPQVLVEVPARAQQGVGTAFSLDDEGTWLTARHVVDGCTRIGILAGFGRVAPATYAIHPQADLAIITTGSAPEPLPVDPELTFRRGQRAFHLGFPQGRPGEATSRLIGRETLVVTGRGERAEPVIAWAETGRTDGLRGTLAGLSGAPALDSQGRVIGVTVAEAPRRGRIYTTAPETFVEALQQAPPDRFGPGEPISIENYGRVADALRRERTVAQVLCLAV